MKISPGDRVLHEPNCSPEHELIKRVRGCGLHGEEMQKMKAGGAGPVDLLVTRIAHFEARVYDAIRTGTRGLNEVAPPAARSCGKGLYAGHTRLQDEINTILCKRAGLIALGKASGISGIPNKLTLNVGRVWPPFTLLFLLSSTARNIRLRGEDRSERRGTPEIYIDAPQHAVSQYHLTAISFIRPCAGVRLDKGARGMKGVFSNLCIAWNDRGLIGSSLAL